MDLDQQGQTLGYYGRKRNELEKTEMLPKRRAQARLLLGLRRSSALVFCVKLMAKKRWNISRIYGETSAGSGSNSPNRVSSLLREQLLTHTCLSNVYRSWWRDNTGLKTHTLCSPEGKETLDTRLTLFFLVLGSYFPILVVPAAPYQNKIH